MMISFVISCIVLISSRGVASVEEGDEKYGLYTTDFNTPPVAEEEDPCNKCKEGEQCIFNVFENQYTCVCLDSKCERDFSDPCDPNPCENDGTCMKTDDSYECFCADSFTGNNCLDVLPCDEPCENGGKCKWNGEKMQCEKLEIGSIATTYSPNTSIPISLVIDFCYERPCQNGGTCVRQNSGYQCLCLSDYSGKDCNEDSKTTTTTAGNTIDPSTSRTTPGTTRSSMSPATSEDNKTVSTSPATSEDTTTVSMSPATSEDNTTVSTSPATSEDNTTVSTSPATSEDNTTGSTSPATSEDTTTAVIDFCYESPCQNGGTCVIQNTGYQCLCLSDYSGKDCNEDSKTTTTTAGNTIDPSTSRTTPGTTRIYMSSTTGKETTIESKSPTTISVDTTIEFKSTTTNEVTTIDHDLCISSPCLNNGSCISINNSVRCNCTYPFSGNFCDTDISEKNQSSSNSIVYVCTGSVGAIVFVFLIGFAVLWNLKRVQRRKKERYFHSADLSSLESENSRSYII